MANLQIIRDLCEKKKISIRELAARVNLKDGSLHNLMKTGSTNTKTLEAIARVLGVSAGVFFDDYQESEMAKEIRHLKDILAEKERTISILMEKQK